MHDYGIHLIADGQNLLDDCGVYKSRGKASGALVIDMSMQGLREQQRLKLADVLPGAAT